MDFSHEKQSLAVSGACSIYDGQRSYNYEGQTYFAADLGISALSSSAGSQEAKLLKNTKHYLSDIEKKFTTEPDPRSDLQLLSRNRQQKDQAQFFKDDTVPQVFRKMQPAHQQQGQNNQGYQIQPLAGSTFNRQSPLRQPRIIGAQNPEPFKILAFQDERANNQANTQQKGFFERIFSFGGANENQQQQLRGPRQQQKIENMNDIEQLLLQLRNDLNFDVQQQNFSFLLKQQLGVAIDLTERVLSEQQTVTIQQLQKSIQRAKSFSKQQLYTSEQEIIKQHFNQLEYLTSQKLIKLQINNFPAVEQQTAEKQQFYQQISNFVVNTKGYQPTTQQLDSFYNEITVLRIPAAGWIDFISRRI